MNPAPGLVTDWMTPTAFWMAVLVLCVLALIVVTAEIRRDRTEAEAEPTVYDPDLYHCAAHGHWYGRHPLIGADRTVWTCTTCGAESVVTHAVRKPFDQEAS